MQNESSKLQDFVLSGFSCAVIVTVVVPLALVFFLVSVFSNLKTSLTKAS